MRQLFTLLGLGVTLIQLSACTGGPGAAGLIPTTGGAGQAAVVRVVERRTVGPITP
jgi:hypothetical protein